MGEDPRHRDVFSLGELNESQNPDVIPVSVSDWSMRPGEPDWVLKAVPVLTQNCFGAFADIEMKLKIRKQQKKKRGQDEPSSGAAVGFCWC